MNFYDSLEKVIKLFKDFYKIINNAVYIAKYGERLKIITPWKIIQRLARALAQVQASKKILNEIRQ